MHHWASHLGPGRRAPLPPVAKQGKILRLDLSISCSFQQFWFSWQKSPPLPLHNLFCTFMRYPAHSIHVEQPWSPYCKSTPRFRVPLVPGKPGKMTSFSSPGKVLEFYNFIKNPGKMGVNLEKWIVWGKIVLSWLLCLPLTLRLSTSEATAALAHAEACTAMQTSVLTQHKPPHLYIPHSYL